MAWQVSHEDATHFHVKGNAGLFKVSKKALTAGAIERMQKLAAGGKVRPAAPGKLDKVGPEAKTGAKRFAKGAGPDDTQPTPGSPGFNPTAPVEDDPNYVPQPGEGDRSPFVAPDAGSPAGAKFDKDGAPLNEAAVRQLTIEQTKGALGQNAGPPSDPPSPTTAARDAPDAAPWSLPSSSAAGDSASPPQATQSGGDGKPPVDTSTNVQDPDSQHVVEELNASVARGKQGPGATGGAPGDYATAAEKAAQAEEALGQTEQSNAATLAQTQADQAKEQRAWLGEFQRQQAEHETALNKMFDDYRNSKIDPNHFWADKTSDDKVKMGIGMLISGIGAGLTGQPNLASQYLDRSIERDFESQKANLGKKASVLSYYMDRMHSRDAAMLQTRAVLGNIAAAEYDAQATRLGGTQLAQQHKLQAAQMRQNAVVQSKQAAMLDVESRMKQFELNRMLQMQKMMGEGTAPEPGYVPSGTSPPMLTEWSLKGMSEREKAAREMRVNLPEMGSEAHTYAPSHVAQEVNKTLPEYLNMERNLSVLERLGKQHSLAINTPLIPNQAKEQFTVAHNALNLSMNQLMGQQRFTNEEQQLYGPMIANPSKFLVGKAGEANLKALRGLIQSKRVAEYQRLGLRGSRGGQAPAFTPLSSGN